jgi:hypothetical protein
MLSGESRLRNIAREVLPALRETETKRDTTVTYARKRAPTTTAFLRSPWRAERSRVTES